ncbi:MAG TPA: signal peptidase II [Candidatus Dormibacteraeota bacterium]|nr:signal peptidase II [Candidatus Dormibacteraeota bacterium]
MSTAPRPAGSPWRGLAILLGSAAVVFGIDHLTKWLVVRDIAYGDQVPASGPITLHHIHNTGAAFGLFPGFQAAFLVVAVVVSVYILVVGHRAGNGVLTQITLGAVLGGAAANAVDRFRQGYVVDFIDLHRWPVFNVADAAIVAGIAVTAFTLSRRPTHARERAR